MMPPHIRRSHPESGGILSGSVLRFEGYTLQQADLEGLEVTDLTTGGSIEHSVELHEEWVGYDPPGHVGGRQLYCELRVHLRGLKSGHRYRAQVLDTTLEFTWAGP